MCIGQRSLRLRRAIAILIGTLVICASSLTRSAQADDVIEVGGVGNEAQGAGVATAYLNDDPGREIVLMAYDNPPGANTFRYRVGYGLNSDGIAPNWSTPITIDGVGDEAQGAGVAIGNFDDNPRPEMVLMAYDNPSGPNTFRYKVGFNLNNGGFTSNWSDPIIVEGVGNEASGAGVAIINIDDDPRPDLIFMANDGGGNCRYRIGWDVNSSGIASSWSDSIDIGNGFGPNAQGAGITVTNLDTDPRPEIVLVGYPFTAPLDAFVYFIGWDMNEQGFVTGDWTPSNPSIPGVGQSVQDADGAILSADGEIKLVLMAYDNPPGPNTFRYRVIPLGSWPYRQFIPTVYR